MVRGALDRNGCISPPPPSHELRGIGVIEGGRGSGQLLVECLVGGNFPKDRPTFLIFLVFIEVWDF